MFTQMMTCPHCGTGFSTKAGLDTHSGQEHHENTAWERDQMVCPTCKTAFKARPEQDALEAEKLRKGVDRIDE
jgi:hypothetical protein